MCAYQPAEAAVQDAEAALVVGHLHEALHVAVVVGAHHAVRVRVDLVDAARRHLQTDGLPRVAPVVLVAVVTLLVQILKRRLLPLVETNKLSQ